METNRLHELRSTVENDPAFIDCTDTHLGDGGIVLPEEIYTSAWQQWRNAPRYTPDPRGREETRLAIRDFYRLDGLEIDPETCIITAGSSLSYELIFHALAAERAEKEDGVDKTGAALAKDETRRSPAPSEGLLVALPRPSYPLFEELSAFGGHTPLWYDLDPTAGFGLDRESVLRVLDRRPTSLVVISPNNPTGTILPEEDVVWLIAKAAEHDVLIISDEVFSAFRPSGSTLPRPARHTTEADSQETTRARVCTLNGLSKIAAAPEIKLGWITVSGPGSHTFTERLAYLHDTYLSVSGYAEHFAVSALATGAEDMMRIGDEIAERRDATATILRKIPGVSLTEPTGGIHLIFSIGPDRAQALLGSSDDEEIALKLLGEERVFLHPGYLYGINEIAPWFVVSCVSPRCSEGLERLRQRLQ